MITKRKLMGFFAATTCTMVWVVSAHGDPDPGEIKLSTSKMDSPLGPTCYKTPPSLDQSKGYCLTEQSGQTIPAQLDDEGVLWCWGLAYCPGARLSGCIVHCGDSDANRGVKVEQVKDGLINVTIDGQFLTAFHFDKVEPKPFLWPVIGPTGAPVTRAFPMKDIKGERQDHPHHRSIWTAWGDIRTADYEKPGANYWSQAKNPADQDRQIVKRIVRTVSGPVFGKIEAEIAWTRHDGQRDFTEYRTYTFFRGDDASRVIDVKNVFKFTDRDVMFYDTKEAGIVALRIATSMDEISLEDRTKPGKGLMINSNGKTTMAQCWGQPAEWCDYDGPVDGQTVGIAIFDAKTNFRHPTRWHIRDYGLFAANPITVKAFKKPAKGSSEEQMRAWRKSKPGSYVWKKGDTQEFNYRILIHKGDTKAARVAEQYELYTEPPAVELK